MNQFFLSQSRSDSIKLKYSSLFQLQKDSIYLNCVTVCFQQHIYATDWIFHFILFFKCSWKRLAPSSRTQTDGMATPGDQGGVSKHHSLNSLLVWCIKTLHRTIKHINNSPCGSHRPSPSDCDRKRKKLRFKSGRDAEFICRRGFRSNSAAEVKRCMKHRSVSLNSELCRFITSTWDSWMALLRWCMTNKVYRRRIRVLRIRRHIFNSILMLYC